MLWCHLQHTSHFWNQSSILPSLLTCTHGPRSNQRSLTETGYKATLPIVTTLPHHHVFPSLSPCCCTAGPASENLRTDSLCYKQSHHGGGGSGHGLEDSSHDDPTVPLIRENVYAWYLAVSDRLLASFLHVPATSPSFHTTQIFTYDLWPACKKVGGIYIEFIICAEESLEIRLKIHTPIHIISMCITGLEETLYKIVLFFLLHCVAFLSTS